MTKRGIVAAACLVAMAVMVAGCGHKLVAQSGRHVVEVYPDQQTYEKITNLKEYTGMAGMMGKLGESISTARVADQTPVKILSSNDKGAMVEILSGPDKGLKGFVPKNNVK